MALPNDYWWIEAGDTLGHSVARGWRNGGISTGQRTMQSNQYRAMEEFKRICTGGWLPVRIKKTDNCRLPQRYPGLKQFTPTWAKLYCRNKLIDSWTI